MSSSAADNLRTVNRSLRARLAQLSGDSNNSATITPTAFTDLLAELRRTTDFLRNLPTAATLAVEIANEISGYRKNVEQLGKILPAIQGRLLVERARLETARTHVAKAAAWAQGSKKTL